MHATTFRIFQYACREALYITVAKIHILTRHPLSISQKWQWPEMYKCDEELVHFPDSAELLRVNFMQWNRVWVLETN